MEWFLPDGSRNVVRHAVNNRTQTAVRNKYARGILKHGILEGCRGEAWLVEPASQGQPYQAVTFGTLWLGSIRNVYIYLHICSWCELMWMWNWNKEVTSLECFELKQEQWPSLNRPVTCIQTITDSWTPHGQQPKVQGWVIVTEKSFPIWGCLSQQRLNGEWTTVMVEIWFTMMFWHRITRINYLLPTLISPASSSTSLWIPEIGGSLRFSRKRTPQPTSQSYFGFWFASMPYSAYPYATWCAAAT